MTDITQAPFAPLAARKVPAIERSPTPLPAWLDRQAFPFAPTLVDVSDPRSSGKRTLISGLVDFINRSRRDHVITIEGEINIVHDRAASLISQREVRGGGDEMLRVAETALREDPDVLVLEEVRTPALMDLALDAAASGHLVIVGLAAHTATGAIDRIIDLYQPGRWEGKADLPDDFVFYSISDIEDEEAHSRDITPAVIRDGLARLIAGGGWVAAQVMEYGREDLVCGVDATAADVIIQMGVLGEVVYG